MEATAQPMQAPSHGLLLGYLLWLMGFTGAHRFYYGKPITGTIWLCTFGLCGIGWLIDAFLIPGMDRAADRRYPAGRYSYPVAWLLLSYLGVFGIHRFYMGKVVSGVFYLLTCGWLFVGVAYDFWTLNEQLAELNRESPGNSLLA